MQLAFVLTRIVFAAPAPLLTPNKWNCPQMCARPSAKIDRSTFGQLAEHLRHRLYDQILVGTMAQLRSSKPIILDVTLSMIVP